MNVIKNVLDGNWSQIQKDVDQMAADKIKTKIDDKKIEVLANLNKVDKDEMINIMNK